jgi:hypothetical protein
MYLHPACLTSSISLLSAQKKGGTTSKIIKKVFWLQHYGDAYTNLLQLNRIKVKPLPYFLGSLPSCDHRHKRRKRKPRSSRTRNHRRTQGKAASHPVAVHTASHLHPRSLSPRPRPRPAVRVKHRDLDHGQDKAEHEAGWGSCGSRSHDSSHNASRSLVARRQPPCLARPCSSSAPWPSLQPGHHSDLHFGPVGCLSCFNLVIFAMVDDLHEKTRRGHDGRRRWDTSERVHAAAAVPSRK